MTTLPPPPGPVASGLGGLAAQQPADPAGAAPPVITVVLDPRDEHGTTRAALTRHDPAGGRITVQPTPGAKGLLNLAHDLLVALGLDPSAAGWERRSLGEAWRQVTAWVIGRQILEITVLRSHLLTRTALARLAQLAADTGAALTLVWHTRPPGGWESVLPAATLTVLDGIQEAFAAARAARPRRSPPSSQPTYCPPILPQLGGQALERALARPLPSLPTSELPRFRADLYRLLADAEFSCADALYAAGMDAACAFLTGHPDYDPAADATGGGGTPAAASSNGGSTAGSVSDLHLSASRTFPQDWPDHEGVVSFLLSAVTASPSHEHSLVLLRGAQAGFLRHGLLVALPPDPGQGGGPGFSDTMLTPQIADQIRARTAHPVRAAALALLLASGLDVHQLAWVHRGDLADDASTLLMHDYSTQGLSRRFQFPIPMFVRDLMEAARAYGSLEEHRPERLDPLLAEGIGNRQWIVYDTARHCGLDLQDPPHRPHRQPWHTSVRCARVGDPIHTTVHSDPGKAHGVHLPQA